MPEGRVFHFSVDLDKELQKTILHDIFVTENRNAHTFHVKVTRSGAAVDLSGASVSGTFSRYKTRETVVIPSGSVDGEFVVLTLPPECYNIKTTFCLIINVVMGGMTLSVFAGEGNMLLNRFDRIDNTGGVIPSLGELLAQIDAMKTATDRANAGADRVEQLQIDASGLAGDSNKLGGKPPEYYLPAVDLMDNSNFRNPINQRGGASYTGGTTASYWLDRWQFGRCNASLVDGGLSVAWDGANSNNGYFQQAIGHQMKAGEKYTIGVKVGGQVQAYPFTVPDDASQNLYFDTNAIRLMPSGGIRWLVFYNYTTTAKVYEWVALYEGTYTADTLPPYVPPDPVLELAKCQEYYVGVGSDAGIYGYSSVSGILYAFVPLPQFMRLKNVSLDANSKIIIVSNGVSVEIGEFMGVTIRGNQLELKAAADSKIPVLAALSGWVSKMGISADL